MTSQNGELVYKHNGVVKTANWNHLCILFKAESQQSTLKLSKLTEMAVAPKHTEKMSVTYCLQVFCKETKVALLTNYSTKDLENIEDTADFIGIVEDYWTICNVKCAGMAERKNDARMAEFRSPSDRRLDFLLEFGEMCLAMKAVNQRKRGKELTKDTVIAISHTCFAI